MMVADSTKFEKIKEMERQKKRDKKKVKKQKERMIMALKKT